MPTTPKSVSIRTYQVGFGDCFLLSFQYGPKSERHVLIDFGSTGLPKDVPKTRMTDIANDIKQRTGGKLHAVVATHRHKDHISGFETSKGGKRPGDIIRRLKPDVVVQPWTEDPELAPKATGPKSKGFRLLMATHISALSSMHEVAGRSIAESKRLARYLPKTLKEQLSFLGEDNLSNKGAVKNLMTMGKNAYVFHGSKSGLQKVLPGVKVHVLGPPTLEQTSTIKKQRSKDADEFWHYQANAMRFAESAKAGKRTLFPKFVRSHGPSFPVDSRWLIYHARAIRGEQLLQIVRTLDTAMNNTSVILVLEVAGKKLLFPGDAQIENWQYAFNQPKSAALLRSVNLYKVGHHGSLNATPKTLWNMFKNRTASKSSAKRMKSLMSTMEGKHGSEERGTEVPRTKLVTALNRETELFSTEKLDSQTLYRDTVMAL